MSGLSILSCKTAQGFRSTAILPPKTNSKRSLVTGTAIHDQVRSTRSTLLEVIRALHSQSLLSNHLIPSGLTTACVNLTCVYNNVVAILETVERDDDDRLVELIIKNPSLPSLLSKPVQSERLESTTMNRLFLHVIEAPEHVIASIHGFKSCILVS